MRIFDSVEQLRAGLDYHLARHNLLVANLGHADTPGFKPLDLQRGTATSFSGALHAAMAATQPGHFGAAAEAASVSPFPTSSASAQTSPAATAAGHAWKVVQDGTAVSGNDGNAVSLDHEAVKIASNQLRYDTLASLVQNQLSGLEWAANDGK